MKKKLQYLLFYIILVIIFYNCASIGQPSGGPADIHAPYLLEENTLPLVRTNISINQKIILSFNERISPSSAINALRIEPEIDISIRIRNNTIYLKPKESWPNQFKLFISRNLSDYNNNKLTSPIQLAYSLSDSIILKKIIGSIFNIDSTKIYELVLLDKNLSIISKTESNSDGKFIFSTNNINPSNIILALENQITDNFINDIRIKKYGISNRPVNIKYNPIYLSDPIYRAKINNINLINSNFGEVILSTGQKFYLLLNNMFMKERSKDNNNYIYKDYDFQDSINININMSNTIETYNLNDSFIFTDQLMDTSSADIEWHKISNDSLLIKFTEPIIVDETLRPFYSLGVDSMELIFNYNYINPHSLYIDNNSTNGKINIRCNAIKDLNDNDLCDSILSLNFSEDNSSSSNSFGEINGTIHYDGKNKLIVEAINLNTDDMIRQEINDNHFIFNELLPGDYKIWAYESINPIGNNYFSGTLEPIKESAKFIIYNKDLYVRANWSNTVSMELK